IITEQLTGTGLVKVTASDVTLDGFTIQTGGGPVVTMPGCVWIYQEGAGAAVTGVTIENNIIVNPDAAYVPSLAGICTTGSCQASVENNLISSIHMGVYLNQGGGMVISNNTIEDSNHCSIGVDSDVGVTIIHNTLHNANDMGIEVFKANVVANFNNITDTNLGVNSVHGLPVDATFNWWGDVTGPEQVTTNPDGKGNKVSDNVYYIPWLTRNFETVLTEGIGYYGYPMVELLTGWNLLSTPFALDPDYCDTWAEFASLNELPLYTGGDEYYVNAYYFDGDVQD
ncbi:unnamed protein product, partial [marine sediment metagenome]